MARISIAFLLALAVVAATLHPSAAASTGGDDASSSSSTPARSLLPSLPPWGSMPSFPCIPGMPKLPFFHCTAPAPAAPPPAECGTPLKALMPCADFLTNVSARAPAGACCDGLKSVVEDAAVCFCHIANGDFAKLLPAPMLRLRMLMLPRVCAAPVPRGTLLQCFTGTCPTDEHSVAREGELRTSAGASEGAESYPEV
ncbi:hypothetical protein ACP4OV_016987 [Aristida adscensionis]